MHIITGLLLAKLLKARVGPAGHGRGCGGRTSPLCNMPRVITLVHALPGRCRFRLPVLVGQTTAGNKLEKHLRSLEGVVRVSVRTTTGSVLIEYDAAQWNPEVLAAALVRLLGLERAFSGRVEARLGREIRTWARALNVAVYQQTGGALDLRTVLLLALASVGIKKLITQRAVAFPAGFTLLWWAGSGLLGGDGESE